MHTIKQDKLRPAMAERPNTPLITPSMVRGVSEYRRDMLEQELAEGKFKDGSTGVNYAHLGMGITAAGNVKIGKKASGSGDPTSGFGWGVNTSGGTSYQGPGGTVRQVPEVYSPLWLNSNLNLPRDRATINAWCRSFFALNPLVQNAISLHSTYPISKLNIKISDPKKQQFFDDMIDELDLLNVCVQIAQEYWCLGEAIPYGDFDTNTGKWSRILIQNPDYISIGGSVIAGEPDISLRPDENLKRICTSNRPVDIQQRQQLHKSIVEHVKRGQNIPLSNFYVSHIARKIAPYEYRGTGLPVSCFKALMLFDKLRECKYAQAEDLINPIRIFKIGGADYKPTPADIEQWRDVFEQAYTDKNFRIFTHEQVAVEVVNSGSGIYDTSNDITQLIKEIYTGLMAPSVIMDGGSDVSYANGGVSLDVLRQRYMTFRNMIASWLKRKIFAPVSQVNEFYEYKDGVKVLMVPEVEWNHMSLFDAGDYIQTISGMLSAQPKTVSMHTVYRSLGLTYEDEKAKIKREDIDMMIRDKEMKALSKMDLNALRALSDEDVIQEVKESPVPGENQYTEEEGGMPGAPGGGGGGMDMGGGLGGGMPPMPDLGGGGGMDMGGGGDAGIPPPPV